MSKSSSETVQVLTFMLGNEEYCIPIRFVAEIVEGTTIRRLPNTNQHVKGVTDLRGETTTVIDPTDVFDVDTSEFVTDDGKAEAHVIVLDTDTLDTDSATGWLVSEVNEVRDAERDQVDSSVAGTNEYVHGFLQPTDERDGFTIWVDPHELTA